MEGRDAPASRGTGDGRRSRRVRGAGARSDRPALCHRRPHPPRPRPGRGRDPGGARRRLARLSALRDPDRFDAWLRRLLVRACYRESRQARSHPTIDVHVPSIEPTVMTDRSPWPIATRSSAGSAASTPSSARSSSCTTTSASPSRRWPMPSESPWGPRSRGSTARPARSARRSMPTRAAHSRSKGGRHEHERRRPPPLRLAGNGRPRARAGTPARHGASRGPRRTRRRPAWRIPERWIPMTTITTPVTSGGSARWPLAILTALLVLALVAGAILVAGSRRTAVPAPFGPASNGVIVHDSGGDLVSVDLVTRGEHGDPRGRRPAARAAVLARRHRAGVPRRGRPVRDRAGRVRAPGRRRRRLGGAVARHVHRARRRMVAVRRPDRHRVARRRRAGDHDRRCRAVAPRRCSISACPPSSRRSGPPIRTSSRSAVRRRTARGGCTSSASTVARRRTSDLDQGFELDGNYGVNSDYYFFAPAWSPDGRRLAYFTLEESTVDPDPDSGSASPRSMPPAP